MMSQPQIQHYTTEAEYLAFENDGEIRHEYVDGQTYAMAGAGDRHNRATGNVFFHLRRQTRHTHCVTYQSDMKLRLDSGRYFYYPDVMLCCDPQDNVGGYFREQPCVIVEVSSPSTSSIDRREKLLNYQRNANNQWEKAALDTGEVLAIRCGDSTLQLTLEDIYEDMG
ncbi:MAG: Uma2 family endonuclease, partial [Thiothrix litoralis]